MDLHPQNPNNLVPNIMTKNALPGYTPPYHQLAAAPQPTGSLTSWQRVPFASAGESIGFRGHKIYSERRKPQGSSSFERRYPVSGPLVRGTFNSVAQAKKAIRSADSAQRKTQQKKAEQKSISRAASMPKPVVTQEKKVSITLRPQKRETSAPQQMSTTHSGPRASIDAPDPRFQVSSQGAAQRPKPGGASSASEDKGIHPLLIAAVIGIPVIIGTIST